MVGAVVALAIAAPSRAQMSVTTFGATDAQECFKNASRESNRDTTPCDDALRGYLGSADRQATLVNRGIILNRLGRLMEAREDFNAALATNSALPEAYLNRGNTYYLAGRDDQAIRDYELSLQYGVSEPWSAWFNIGLAYESKGDREKAREAYQKALDLSPGFTQAQAKLASLTQ